MAEKSKAIGPGRPKDMRKHAAILEAAKTLFGERGYAGTSMDAVAKRARVSKLTVYSHFGDKDSLFRAAVRARCSELFPEDMYQPELGASARQALLGIALHHARLATSPEAVGMWRAISGGSAERTPQLGALLWEEGPQRVHVLVRDFLRRLVGQGKLSIEDCDVAATQFMALLKGDLHLKCLLHCADGDADFRAQVDANAVAAVDLFVRAYRGPTSADPVRRVADTAPA